MTTTGDDVCFGPIDVLLRERLAGEAPPDLAALVARRRARGEGAEAAAAVATALAATTSRLGARWLAAAIILLGVVVVTAIRFQTDPTQVPAVPAEQGAIAPPDQPAPGPSIPGDQGQEPKGQKPQAKPPLPMPPTAPEPRRGDLGFQLRAADAHGGPVQQFTLDVVGNQPSPDPIYTRTAVMGLELAPRDFVPDFAAVTGLPPGRYIALVSAAGFVRSTSEPFTLEAGGPTPQITVTLETGWTLNGRVLDAEGKPVAGAEVVVDAPPLNLDGGLMTYFSTLSVPLVAKQSRRTDATGAFRIDRLSSGAYLLRVSHPEFCSTRSPLEIAHADPKGGDFVLQRGGIVEGVTLGADGTPTADMEVSIMTGNRQVQTTRSSATGEFRFAERLPPGTYQVHARDTRLAPFAQLKQLQTSRREVKVEVGQNARVQLQLAN